MNFMETDARALQVPLLDFKAQCRVLEAEVIEGLREVCASQKFILGVKCFSYLGYRPEDCPEACRAAAETLAIPIYPELSAIQRRHVVKTIAAFYR
jgi:dTDP-4-amino-4,6-dideoxygalactose transaminase